MNSSMNYLERILSLIRPSRLTIAEFIENDWFKKGYQSPSFERADISLDDVNAIFNESGEPQNLVVEHREERSALMNAFELISTSQISPAGCPDGLPFYRLGMATSVELSNYLSCHQEMAK